MIRLEHIGIAVHKAEAVERMLSDLLGSTSYKTEDVPTQGVRTHFIDAGSAKLELLESIEPESPIARYLEKHKEGIHHLAFEVEDIHTQWARAAERGYRPLGEGPQPGADRKLIFFLHPKDTHGILIEFCQSQPEYVEEIRIPFRSEELALFTYGPADRPPVVLLHGAAGCTRMETDPLARRLSATYRVTALDFGGHGQSDDYANFPFSSDFFLDNVRAVFDYLAVPEAFLFGFSLGGFIALRFAEQYPARVRRLAIHGVNLAWDQALAEKMLERLDPAATRRKSASQVQSLEEMHGKDRWAAIFDRMREYTRALPDNWERYRSVLNTPVRTLITSVDKDDLFPIRAALYLAEHLSDNTLAILPGRRHALQQVDLDLLVPLLQQHFGKQD